MAASLSTVVLLLCSMAGTGVASRQSGVEVVDANAELQRKAQDLLEKYMAIHVTPNELTKALDDDLSLKKELSQHVAGKKPSAALLERARGAQGMNTRALDKAVRRKETPCHCVIEKITNVDMDEDLELTIGGTNIDLDMEDFPVTPDRGPVTIEFVDLDKEKSYGKKRFRGGFGFAFDSNEECAAGCFDQCKEHDKYRIDTDEAELLGVDLDTTMVAAQCNENAKCLCLDMDDTKKHLRALSSVRKSKLDVCSEELKMFDQEDDCLLNCKGMCESIERRVDRMVEDEEEEFGKDPYEIDWEGVCFDEA